MEETYDSYDNFETDTDISVGDTGEAPAPDDNTAVEPAAPDAQTETDNQAGEQQTEPETAADVEPGVNHDLETQSGSIQDQETAAEPEAAIPSPEALTGLELTREEPRAVQQSVNVITSSSISSYSGIENATITDSTSDIQTIIADLFGEYAPKEYVWSETKTDYIVRTDIDGNQTVTPMTSEVQHITYGFNWTWAAGVVLFSIVLYSLLRMVGGILKWKI